MVSLNKPDAMSQYLMHNFLLLSRTSRTIGSVDYITTSNEHYFLSTKKLSASSWLLSPKPCVALYFPDMTWSPCNGEIASCRRHLTGPVLVPIFPVVGQNTMQNKWIWHLLFRTFCRTAPCDTRFFNIFWSNTLHIYYDFCTVCRTDPCGIRNFNWFFLSILQMYDKFCTVCRSLRR